MDLLRVFNRRLSTEKFDAFSAQMVSYGVALMIMVLGIRKVATMPLDETQIFFGVLLVMILTLQAVVVGTIVGLYGRKA